MPPLLNMTMIHNMDMLTHHSLCVGSNKFMLWFVLIIHTEMIVKPHREAEKHDHSKGGDTRQAANCDVQTA